MRSRTMLKNIRDPNRCVDNTEMKAMPAKGTARQFYEQENLREGAMKTNVAAHGAYSVLQNLGANRARYTRLASHPSPPKRASYDYSTNKATRMVNFILLKTAFLELSNDLKL